LQKCLVKNKEKDVLFKWSEQSIEREIGKTNCKKRSNLASSAIVNVFAAKNPFTKYHMQQKLIFEDMGLLIVKKYIPIQFV
jgi:hypothetical protein